jgi:hypothetical protein
MRSNRQSFEAGTELFCGLTGASVATAQSRITTMTSAAYSTTDIERRKSKILISKEI